MSADRDLLAELERDGVQLWEDEGKLRYRAPRRVMTEARLTLLRENKDVLLTRIRGDGGLPEVVHDPGAEFEPFPLTDVQSAYLLGRRNAFALGGVGCHGYGELRFDVLDADRMRQAWQALIDRHDMLRATIDLDGSQRVVPEAPPYEIAEWDARQGDGEAALARTRAEMDHRLHDPSSWPLFELRITHTDDGSYLHLSIDFLIADFVSVQLLLDELHRRYADPAAVLEPLELSFRDYLMAERRMRARSRAERDRSWWLERLDELPPAPELPLLDSARQPPPRFRRHQLWLDAERWKRLRASAARHGVTPSVAVLAAYAEVIRRWSRRRDFTLDLTLLSRYPLHPQVSQLIGDFTSVELLAVRAADGRCVRECASALQQRLWEDLDHRLFSGVEAMRELARRSGAAAASFPVVFTSALGLGDPTAGPGGIAAPWMDAADPESSFGELGYGISQTPQVWIDCQVMERGGRLSANWDVRDGILDEQLVSDAFEAFATLLGELAESGAAWETDDPVPLPLHQRRRRSEVNATATELTDELLHERFLDAARAMPDATAVLDRDGSVSYAELLGLAQAVATALRRHGVRPADRVAVSLPKGRAQAGAVLGALLAGAAYVPIDTNQPAARREAMLTRAVIRNVLTDSDHAAGAWPASVTVIAVDTLSPQAPDAPTERAPVAPDDLAYVIFTSGSTGVPKGVMVSHRAAVNTILDINRRLGVGAGDRVLGLASLGFDLSVYDLFGILGVGGTLVLPDPERRGDPSHWAELAMRHEVTVWNSVPAQLQMLADYLRDAPDRAPRSLRIAMLSGDWIPVTLPGEIRARLPDVRLFSLGGATEAAIWSIWFEIGDVDPSWHSIPYGRPLANQTFAVLDESMLPCPDLVAGELFIGGFGVADGYAGDESQTAERFVTNPRTGDRLYRTGDLGRYLHNGDIEFLGREDAQVKIRGHRIELAEIEAALLTDHAVGAATVIAHGEAPLERSLAAFVEPARVTVADAPAPAGLRTVAAVGGKQALARTDPSEFLSYMAMLNELGLDTMLDALGRCGVFTDERSRFTVAEVLDAIPVVLPYRRLVRRWLRALCANGRLAVDGDGRYGGARRRTAAEFEQGWAAAAERQRAVDARAEGLVDYFRSSAERLPELLRGEADPLQVLFPDGRADIAESLYRNSLINRWSTSMLAETIRAIAGDRSGGLRVLEVGGGIGGATLDVLAALSMDQVDYLFTDLSRFFVNLARERLAGVQGVRFGAYDLNLATREQGLLPNSFDVVVAADVIHSTVDVGATLSRLRELIAPGGWLLFVEMTRDQHQIMVSLELLNRLEEHAGDFVDLRRGRDQTFLTRPDWEGALAMAGLELAFALPEADDPLAELGMQLFVARAKRDRAPLQPVQLQRHVAGRLPDYMVPGRIEVVDRLPLTANGKVDQATLRGWVATSTGGSELTGRLPETELERAIAAVWSGLMGVPSIDRDRGFFELGGDSLFAAQIAGRMREVIPQASSLFFDDLLRRLLEGPTVATLAGALTATEPVELPDSDLPADSPLRVLAAGEGTPIVLVRGLGAVTDGLDQLAESLAAGGPVLELPAGPAGEAVAEPVEAVAAAHARLLMSEGHLAVHLAGVDAGGRLALEVARCLLEAGAEVESLTVAGSDAGAERPDPYLGDVRVVSPEDGQLQFWEASCLGDVQVVSGPLELVIAEARL
jgi:pyochelin synthetase